MSNYLKKIISVSVCAVLTVAFIIIMHFAAPKIASLPETYGTIKYEEEVSQTDGTVIKEMREAVIGKDITAVRINDFGRLNKITKVNYVPDKFVLPDTVTSDMRVVDLTKSYEFAEKGTLIFFILNVDPESEDYHKNLQKLSEFKVGEEWHFTLSLPKILNASNVYTDTGLSVMNGSIENYNFVDFVNYDAKTENYSQKATRTTLDVKFHTRDVGFRHHRAITIHYQSSGTSYSGMIDCPLIGAEPDVTGTYEVSRNLIIAFAVLAAVVFTILIVLSILKRTNRFLCANVWLFGIVLMLFPKFMLYHTTVAPLLWAGLSWSAAFFTLGGALIGMGRNIGKVPLKYIFPSLMLVGGVLAFLCPFVPYMAASIFHTIFTVLKAIGAISLLAFTGFATFYKHDEHLILKTMTAATISISIFSSIFIAPVFPVFSYSLFWLCAVAVVLTFIGVCTVISETERSNAYLTANLNMEVASQLKDIKAVITERDDLLRFVSHDMKKPLQSSASLLDVLIERENDVEQIKTLQIVKQNNSRVINNLSEIGVYAKFNYIAEPSQTTDLSELCASIYDFHNPDCNANGIILNNLVTKRFKVFVKKQGLENAISNIVLNAIEHANCNSITLTAKTQKNKIILSIADDGTGIADGVELFKAYSSEKKETGGVGLFICKNIIESMNGELTYESQRGCTVFRIALLKA